MIVWLAAVFVIAGLVLAVWSMKPEPKMVHIGVHPDDVVPTSRTLELERSAGERIMTPIANRLASSVGRYLPSGVLDATAKQLRVADMGAPWTPELVVGLQIGGFAIGSLLAATYINSTGFTRTSVLVGGMLVLILTMAPNAKVKRKANDRRKAITNELPDVLDQLKVTVEAGMSFDGALLRAGQEGRGLLTSELLKAVNDMQLGLTRGEALQALSDRTDVPDLRQFVTAVRQAEKHGFPLANILKLQSLELRDRRRARAEERAMQVPVKITFPLVFCILPALFIVILGPAGLSIANGF